MVQFQRVVRHYLRFLRPKKWNNGERLLGGSWSVGHGSRAVLVVTFLAWVYSRGSWQKGRNEVVIAGQKRKALKRDRTGDQQT